MWKSFFGNPFTVYFTSPKIPFDNIFEEGIENNLIKLIDDTKKTIDVAAFEFDLVNAAGALIRAHQRKVIVRLVYDDQFADTEIIRSLIASGIQIVADNRSAFMHNKFFIFDRKYVWTGSFNVTSNAAYRNNENAILICDSKLAKNYSLEFQEMFIGQFGINSPDNTEDVFSIRGIRVENYFAPESEVMGHIVKLVETAKQSVHFLAFSFTDDSLAKALIDKMAIGVLVSGVFEKRGSKRKSSKFSMLKRSGASVLTDGNPRTMHNKIIIIDSKIVIFGSYNFSSNASQVNDENLLIIYDPFIANKYEKEFQRIFLVASKAITVKKTTKRGI